MPIPSPVKLGFTPLVLRDIAAMLAASVAVAGVLVATGAGTGRAASPPSTPGSAPATLRTTVYFLTDEGAAPIGVRRAIARSSPHALQALRTLLAGPSRKERAAGIISAIPPDARVLSLSFRGRGGTEAVVDLTGLPPVMGVRPGRSPSVLSRIRVITQVARTVIGLSGIERVRVRVDGRLWDQPTHEGRIGDAATDYDRLLGWWRVCSGQRTAEERARGLVRCFAALP